LVTAQIMIHVILLFIALFQSDFYDTICPQNIGNDIVEILLFLTVCSVNFILNLVDIVMIKLQFDDKSKDTFLTINTFVLVSYSI